MSLSDELEKINQTREALLHRLEQLGAEAVAWRPRPDAWSLLEVVEHLVLAEREVFVDVDRLDELPERRRTLGNAVRYWVVLGILRFRIPVAVPSEGMRPTGGRSLRDLRRDWEDQQRRFADFVDHLGPGDERRAIFRHPVTGPVTVAGGVRMLRVHLNRHVGQADKIARMWAERRTS